MKRQRNTAQKRMILGALEYADHLPTATELYEMVRQKNEHISKATVFRVLAQSAENGDILKVHLCGTDERYDATIMPQCARQVRLLRQNKGRQHAVDGRNFRHQRGRGI